MSSFPKRIFFDTNVFIIGAAMVESPEATILDWAGFAGSPTMPVEIIVSDVLIEQILRVARRIRGKDWAGEIVSRIWQGMNIRYVLLNQEDIARLIQTRIIPREDVEIYLTAKVGEADCFVSANRELIRIIAEKQGDFECLDPEGFVDQYLQTN